MVENTPIGYYKRGGARVNLEVTVETMDNSLLRKIPAFQHPRSDHAHAQPQRHTDRVKLPFDFGTLLFPFRRQASPTARVL